MLASFLLVFREVLEAALIVSIVMAATRGVAGRGMMILSGIGMGLVGAVLLALMTDFISSQFDGLGQEVFNAAVLLSACALLTWHVVWMSSHGRELAVQMKSAARAVADGLRPLSALAFVIAAAVLREGAEIVLFMQGLSAEGNAGSLWLGCVGGLLAGGIMGALLYLGMIRLPIGQLFSATNGLLVVVAAGMAAKAASYLTAAGWLPEIAPRVWDSSAILPDDSFVGETLAAFMGYTATPTGIQVLFFAATVALIVMLSRTAHNKMQAA